MNPVHTVFRVDEDYFNNSKYAWQAKLTHRTFEDFMERCEANSIESKDGETFLIFSADVHLFLIDDSVPCTEVNTEDRVVLPQSFFRNSYIKGYEEGRTNFRKMYRNTRGLLSPASAFALNHYSTFLLRICSDDWYPYASQQCRFLISDLTFETMGFRSGMLHELQVLVRQYPMVLKDFNHWNEIDSLDENDAKSHHGSWKKRLESLTILDVFQKKHMDQYQEILDILKDPVLLQLDSENKFIGREPGKMVIFWQELIKAELVQHIRPNAAIITVLANTFPDWEITEGGFSSVKGNQYYEDTSRLIRTRLRSVIMGSK